MRFNDCTPGTGVVYRPHPNARAEDGTIVRQAAPPIVFVLFVGDRQPKACYADDLEAAR